MDFEKIHELGAKRHPKEWFTANIAAVNATNYQGADPSDKKIKALISQVVLQVLDAVKK